MSLRILIVHLLMAAFHPELISNKIIAVFKFLKLPADDELQRGHKYILLTPNHMVLIPHQAACPVQP